MKLGFVLTKSQENLMHSIPCQISQNGDFMCLCNQTNI